MRDINVNESFFFNPVTPEEVELEILQTPSNKSFRLYSFPINILKSSRCILSSPLATVFNTSISSGTFPDKLKTSKITPIFKDGEDNDPSNYRLISILSVFNRIFEKLMYNRLNQFIEHKKLLNNAQYGFRTSHSTTHAVLGIVNTIQNNMDNRLFSCAVFIDLQKAFDSVNHSILLKKLDRLGVRGCINNWFESYLSGRKQTTEIDRYISQKEINSFGVPHGSVLGPLLFLLFIQARTQGGGCTGCTCTPPPPGKKVPLRNVQKRRESSAQICRQKRMCTFRSDTTKLKRKS